VSMWARMTSKIAIFFISTNRGLIASLRYFISSFSWFLCSKELCVFCTGCTRNRTFTRQ
jgi:hypothetical protein